MADSAAEARIDQALVARALLGNEPRAFDQLVRRHQGMRKSAIACCLFSTEASEFTRT